MNDDLIGFGREDTGDISPVAVSAPRAQANTIQTAVTADQLQEIFLGSGRLTKSGATVNPQTAMSVAAVYASVRVLSEGIAQLPLRLYDQSGDVPEVFPGILDDLLWIEPNNWQSPFEFKRFLVVSLLLRGNFYAHKFMANSAKMRLVPLHPDAVTPEMGENGEIVYVYRTPSGGFRRYRQDEVLHIRGLSSEGLVGQSVISAAREAIGVGMQAENHGARLFSNGAQPGIMLEHPGTLSEDAAKRLRDSFDERHASADNAHRTMLLEEGMKVTKLGMTADELQFIESRKFQRSEIAMFFGVPPHMIGDIERGTSWGSGIEQQGLGFVRYTLRPWLENITDALDRCLLTKTQRRRLGFGFDVDSLTKGDFKTRQEGLKIQFDAGVITAAQWAAREGIDYNPDETSRQPEPEAPAEQPEPADPDTQARGRLRLISDGKA